VILIVLLASGALAQRSSRSDPQRRSGASSVLARYRLEPERLFPQLPVKYIVRVIQRRGQYLILDTMDHRLLFVSPTGQVVRQLGRIGQDVGEFFYPNDMAVDAHGYIYIRDGQNRRYQVFRWDGAFVAQFPNVPDGRGLAVTSKGEVLIGQPQKGKLVSVYSREGTFLRSFGELHKLSDFYGPGVADLDAAYAHAINRVKLCVDRRDQIYVAFMGAPVFQKYDASGRLVFEKRLVGQEAEEIIAGFRKQRQSPVRRGIDDVPTPLIITGIAVDDATGNIYISFQWDRAWIYVANSRGEGIALLDLPQRELLLENIELSEDGTALLAARLSVTRTDEAYRLALPPPLRRRS
jgi:DNA-binding beta-propeller fold protein YncE